MGIGLEKNRHVQIDETKIKKGEAADSAACVDGG